MEIRNEKLAYNLINNSISLKEGENLLIEVMGEDGIELANEIIKQAKQINAKTHINVINLSNLKDFLIRATEEEIKEYAEENLIIMKKMQAYISISSPKKDKLFEGVSKENMKAYNKYYVGMVHLEQRVKHTKWCILIYPNEYYAKKCNLTLDEFKDFYYNVCNVDYRKMKKAMEPLKSIMDKTYRVHILAPGTDLTFSIKNIPAEMYFGTYNIPDGEVATCPVKESINGYLTYNTKTKYNDIIFEDIRFEFENGKIVTATAKNNIEELNEILDMDEGARYIGEFAFGLNPYINNTMLDTLFDEKINGSFHFTPGMAIEESDNGNRSVIHWDIVKILRKEYGGGEIYFDNVLIMKDGKFVLNELKGLNAENLK